MQHFLLKTTPLTTHITLLSPVFLKVISSLKPLLKIQYWMIEDVLLPQLHPLIMLLCLLLRFFLAIFHMLSVVLILEIRLVYSPGRLPAIVLKNCAFVLAPYELNINITVFLHSPFLFVGSLLTVNMFPSR